ncbi:hypothetical protein CIW49_03125 [Mycolicibacterium sp. P1-18]|uniref:hypothetical protein n=1 Tax=Mycolicibacterium sp. P1-18 TaxID=2024615 RepID=UPI0011F21351|nr:hypothetical protein [Mycolicibacterium sp. P1-18]KAA0102318.1 hypothetical protein CIW49_03125 [Mycolicibacterium sp. P1-18]
MPDDLLRHVIGPTPYSSSWLWLAVGLTVLLVAWYVGVFVVTMPRRRLRAVPLVGATRDRMIRFRAARNVRAIGDRYRAGDLAAAPAGEAVSRELRRFLHQVSGVRAEYMQVDDLQNSEIASAAPVLAALVDVRFNTASRLDVSDLSRDAEELIRSWA